MSFALADTSKQAPNPDVLLNWVLKEYTELLAQPVTDISELFLLRT